MQGKELRQRRIALGLTQESLGEMLGISHSLISRVENGHEQPFEKYSTAIDLILRKAEEGRAEAVQRVEDIRALARATTQQRPTIQPEQEVEVVFNGNKHKAALADGKVWINVRAFCEFLGVSFGSQRDVIDRNERLKSVVSIISTTASDGKRYETLHIWSRRFPLWLANISPRKVSAHVRPLLESYQDEFDRVVEEHFFGVKAQAPAPPLPVGNTLHELLQVAISTQKALAQGQQVLAQDQQVLKSKISTILQTVEHESKAREDLAVEVGEIKSRLASAGGNPYPSPSSLPSPLTIRKLIGRLVRGWCIKNSGDYEGAWRFLYVEFRDRYGVDIPARSRKRNKAKLDVAEEDRLLVDLYNLAYFHFPPEKGEHFPPAQAPRSRPATSQGQVSFFDEGAPGF